MNHWSKSKCILANCTKSQNILIHKRIQMWCQITGLRFKIWAEKEDQINSKRQGDGRKQFTTIWKEPFNNKSKELIAFHLCGTLPIILSRLKCSHLLATVGFWTNKMETSVTVSNGLMERLESFIGRSSTESSPLKVEKTGGFAEQLTFQRLHFPLGQMDK